MPALLVHHPRSSIAIPAMLSVPTASADAMTITTTTICLSFPNPDEVGEEADQRRGGGINLDHKKPD